MAELAAILATTLAAIAVVPQLRRVIVAGDGRGVSLTSAVLGVATEVAWVGYTTASDLWSALPESVLMTVSNAVLAVALVRRGARAASAAIAGIVWSALLVGVVVWGGVGGLAIVLAGAYAVQVGPAVWTVWRTSSPSGVAAATWVMIGIEGLLWGVYGMHHGDPATVWLAVIAVVAATATLTAKALRGGGQQPQRGAGQGETEPHRATHEAPPAMAPAGLHHDRGDAQRGDEAEHEPADPWPKAGDQCDDAKRDQDQPADEGGRAERGVARPPRLLHIETTGAGHRLQPTLQAAGQRPT